ncbi:DNA polymerase subunit Cdc27 [Nemania abortiva]|nr:DNA polymerase subunit Cdc27 [Nemania abortiva]
MDDYKQYLAQKILTEDQVVTYRLLSRALKVHVNTAKEMLYDFHKWQNDKRPGTLHATYIIYGTNRRLVQQQPQQKDGDVEMTDSQMSEDVDASYSDLVPTYTLSLVTQEQLEESLSQYTEVTSVHVYSLAPHPLKDLQLLTDTARQVLELSTADNVSNPSKVYGTIANPNMRRRERKAGPIPVPKVESKPSVKQEAKPAVAAAVKEEPKANSKPTVAFAPSKKPTPTSSLKRQASSGIGQMFAKAAAKPRKPAAKASESPTTSAAASGAEDNQATGAMSDDGEDDAELEPMAGVKREDASARQARKDRQAELRRMMEESDEEEEPEEDAASPEEDDPMDEEPPPQEPEPESKAEEPAEVVSSTGGGRRRGRRRVTRKKQIMDDKGYLVTIHEQGWESFSEDEAPPPPSKPKSQLPKAESTTKPKKSAAKGTQGAQGNIMSFFSKK